MTTVRLDSRKRRLIVIVPEDITSTRVEQSQQKLEAEWNRLDDAVWSELQLDLRNARIVDSMGLNWIYTVSRRVRAEGKKLVIRVSSPAVLKVLDFVGMRNMSTIKYRRRRQMR